MTTKPFSVKIRPAVAAPVILVVVASVALIDNVLATNYVKTPPKRFGLDECTKCHSAADLKKLNDEKRGKGDFDAQAHMNAWSGPNNPSSGGKAKY